MEAIEKFLIRDANGTPTHVAKVYQDSDYERQFDENYGVGIITNAFSYRKNPAKCMDQGESTSTVYSDNMEPQRNLDTETVMRIICDCVTGLYAPADRDDLLVEWDEENDWDTAKETYSHHYFRRASAVDKIMEQHADKFMADNGIVWDSYEGYYSDSATWLVFSTTKMREAGNIEHDKAKEYVTFHVKVLRQINEGEVYGYTVYELKPIQDLPEHLKHLQHIIEHSDLTIEVDGVWYEMADEDSCWGFVGYESHEQAIKDGFLPCGEYKFSTLK